MNYGWMVMNPLEIKTVGSLFLKKSQMFILKKKQYYTEINIIASTKL